MWKQQTWGILWPKNGITKVWHVTNLSARQKPQKMLFLKQTELQKILTPWQVFVTFLRWLSDHFKGCWWPPTIRDKVTAWITWSIYNVFWGTTKRVNLPFVAFVRNQLLSLFFSNPKDLHLKNQWTSPRNSKNSPNQPQRRHVIFFSPNQKKLTNHHKKKHRFWRATWHLLLSFGVTQKFNKFTWQRKKQGDDSLWPKKHKNAKRVAIRP